MQYKISALKTPKKELIVSADRFEIVGFRGFGTDNVEPSGVYFFNDVNIPHWYKSDEEIPALVAFLPGTDWIIESDAASA